MDTDRPFRIFRLIAPTEPVIMLKTTEYLPSFPDPSPKTIVVVIAANTIGTALADLSAITVVMVDCPAVVCPVAVHNRLPFECFILLPVVLVILVFSKVVFPFVVTFLRHFQ